MFLMLLFICVDVKPGSTSSPRVYLATSYGADPTGKVDSTDALLAAMADVVANGNSEGILIDGVANLGGAQLYLQGGNYLISRPLRFPASGFGNFLVRLFFSCLIKYPYLVFDL